MSGFTKATLYLPTADYRRLKALALRESRPCAGLIREAITEYLGRRGTRRLPRSLGSGHSGCHAVSKNADRLLDGMGRR